MKSSSICRRSLVATLAVLATSLGAAPEQVIAAAAGGASAPNRPSPPGAGQGGCAPTATSRQKIPADYMKLKGASSERVPGSSGAPPVPSPSGTSSTQVPAGKKLSSARESARGPATGMRGDWSSTDGASGGAAKTLKVRTKSNQANERSTRADRAAEPPAPASSPASKPKDKHDTAEHSIGNLR